MSEVGREEHSTDDMIGVSCVGSPATPTPTVRRSLALDMLNKPPPRERLRDDDRSKARHMSDGCCDQGGCSKNDKCDKPFHILGLVQRWRTQRESADEKKEKVNVVKKKAKHKHSQSAMDCKCYEDSVDKNFERNYILSFLAKPPPLVEEEIKRGVKDESKKLQVCEGENYTRNKRSKINKKDALKRANSITLRRNRIIPVNDGSRKNVLLTQTTTIKETRCPQDQADLKICSKKDGNAKLNNLNKQTSQKYKTLKRSLSNIFLGISTLKTKCRELFKKKRKTVIVKEERKEELSRVKPIIEFENVPGQDDFVEECFQEECPQDDFEQVDEEFTVGRVSVCSSQYFTPMGSPMLLARRDGSSLECEEVLYEGDDSDSAASEPPPAPPPGVALDSIRRTLDCARGLDRGELRRRQRAGDPLFPNCDNSVWMRSCEKEITEPLRGTTTGMIPVWLRGSLLRNGPGSMRVGDMTFHHLFDSSALLHRFAISNGQVTYQCRFLRSRTFLKNHEANRIVVNEFGTEALPDPCHSIFKRVSALFDPGESLSDNAMISVYPIGDEFYCFTESPTIHRIDPTTLETLERVNVSHHVAVVNHTSHPHVAPDGSVYNQAVSVRRCSPHYSIVKFPYAKGGGKASQMFESGEVVASVRARWPLHPSYMHTFGLTERFFVIVEQPMTVSVPAVLHTQLLAKPMNSCFRFFEDQPTLIHVVDRGTGALHRTYHAEAFFYLHIINQYEIDGHLVIDICCYSDPAMLDCMYYDSLSAMDKNPEYARMFRGRPLRFVLPLDPPPDGDLVRLAGAAATARWRGRCVHVRPELIVDLGCETPRINYGPHLGKPYRYFYAISSDVDLDNPGTLIKVDAANRAAKTWSEPGVYPSEPIFVPSPDPQREDDGVVLSALVWGRPLDTQVGLLVLDAATWVELGRTVFHTPSPVPKCLHGWFAADY